MFSEMFANFNMTVQNDTKPYSPVTLNRNWPTLVRLVTMLLFSTFGTLLNGFFVSAFFIENSLNHIGNVFLACVGVADLMVTSGVMPVSAVVLLSGEWDTVDVCKTLQFIAETSTYSYSLFFVLVGVDSYYKFCKTEAEYDKFTSMRICLISFLVFVFCLLLAGVGVYLDLDYDYCQRLNDGNYYYRITTGVLFFLIPFLVTIYGLFSASIHINFHAEGHNQYKRSIQFKLDRSTVSMNIFAYCLYVFAWIPYLVTLLEYPNVSDAKYYHTVWIGVCRTLITNVIYSFMHESFRRTFRNLFCYCCCKISLPGSYPTRHARIAKFRSNATNVRARMMRHALATASPHRTPAIIEETHSL